MDPNNAAPKSTCSPGIILREVDPNNAAPKSTCRPGIILREVDPNNAVRVRHLVEFMTGKIPVDSNCRTDDLVCFALLMIMIDSGYQPNVSQLTLEQF